MKRLGDRHHGAGVGGEAQVTVDSGSLATPEPLLGHPQRFGLLGLLAAEHGELADQVDADGG